MDMEKRNNFESSQESVSRAFAEIAVLGNSSKREPTENFWPQHEVYFFIKMFV